MKSAAEVDRMTREEKDAYRHEEHVRLCLRITELERELAAAKREIARLKGQK